MKPVKDIIKDKRLEYNLTMKELAEKVGVSEGTISRWESGEIANMRRGAIISLSKVLNIPPNVLMGWDKDEDDIIPPMPTEDDLKNLFSIRLTKIMDEHGLNQNELANILGVSESTVGKWVLKKALPRMGIIQKLADYFNVGKSYFLEESFNNGYYADPETAELAEKLRTDPDMKILFSAAKDLTPEEMQQAADYVNYLKMKGRNK